MPIQELAPVTLAAVEHSLREFESQYNVTSADFLNIIGIPIPDDDAAEWNYLLMQREALQAEMRSVIVPNLNAVGARVHQFVYGVTRFATRAAGTADDCRVQYDCAA